ncbi:MAG: DUF1302 family protein [bacterium]
MNKNYVPLIFGWVGMLISTIVFAQDSNDFFSDFLQEDTYFFNSSGGVALSGFYKQEIAYSYNSSDSNFNFVRQQPEISKIKSILDITLDAKILNQIKLKLNGRFFYDSYYLLKGREKFSSQLLEAHEREIDVGESFIEASITDYMWLKSGRQIIAWGESDIYQNTNVINPQDNRELGQEDITDRYIPALATKLTYLANTGEINLAVIHEVRANKYGASGSDYDPYIRLRSEEDIIIREKLPPSTLDNTQWGFRLRKALHSGDVSLIYADVFDKNPYLYFDDENVTLNLNRIQVYGIAGNYVLGQWLYKFDIARKIKSILMHKDMTEFSHKNIIQGMIGIDFTGITDLRLTLEINHTLIEAYKKNLQDDELSREWLITATYNMFNNCLHHNLFWTHLSNNNGDIFELETVYAYSDDIQISIGTIFYMASDKKGFIYPYRNNNRIFAGVKYSF